MEMVRSDHYEACSGFAYGMMAAAARDGDC